MMDSPLHADAMRLLTPFLDDGLILRVQFKERRPRHLVVSVRVRDPLVEQGIRDAVRSMRCRVEIGLTW